MYVQIAIPCALRGQYHILCYPIGEPKRVAPTPDCSLVRLMDGDMNYFSKTLALVALSTLFSVPAYAAGDTAAGKAKFDQLCAMCHGASGAGDGPVGASLPPEMKPADLRTGEYKFAVTQEKFAELVQKGGAAVGLNALMPPQGGLTEADIANLYAYIQSLAKK